MDQCNTCICTTPRSTSCWFTNIWSLAKRLILLELQGPTDCCVIYNFYNKLTNLFTYTTLKKQLPGDKYLNFCKETQPAGTARTNWFAVTVYQQQQQQRSSLGANCPGNQTSAAFQTFASVTLQKCNTALIVELCISSNDVSKWNPIAFSSTDHWSISLRAIAQWCVALLPIILTATKPVTPGRWQTCTKYTLYVAGIVLDNGPIC